MLRKIKICTFILMLLTLPRLCPAMDIVPFQIRNQNPVIQIFGMPTLSDARVLPSGKYSTAFTFDLASNYVAENNATESLLLDGESYRFNLSLKGGFPGGLEAGIEVPYMAYGGGTVDGFIQDWHSFFGLPDGGRGQAPNNRLRYQYRRNGVARLSISAHKSGFGDSMFTGGWQCYGDAHTPQAMSLRAAVKIPTGDSGRLLGSGGTDLSLWLIGRSDHKLFQGNATLYGAMGGVYLSPGDILRDMQRHWVAFGTVGAGWSPWKIISFSIQLDATTAFYNNSSFSTFSGNTVGLLLGGAVALGERTSLELGVGEDLAVSTWPDVTFHMGVTHRF